MPSPDADHVVHTERLDLVCLDLDLLSASARGPRAHGAVEACWGGPVDDAWFDDVDLFVVYRDRLAAEPTTPWLMRGIRWRDRDGGALVGHVGFHGGPGVHDLSAWTAVGVEMGWTVLPTWRGRGIATEAVQALSAWALAHAATGVVAGIDPANTASRRVAERTGFRRVGAVDADGEHEDVWLLTDAAVTAGVATASAG